MMLRIGQALNLKETMALTAKLRQRLKSIRQNINETLDRMS